MKILICGGGTIGHVWPVILVGKKLQSDGHNVLFIGSKNKLEKETVEKENIKFKSIYAGKKRAYFSILNYFDIIKTFIGIIQAFMIIIKFRPDVIFAKGGYVTLPIIIWLGFIKIPLVIHESDAILGQANLIASKNAKKICLGFPIKYYSIKNDFDKYVYTGIPVRSEFISRDVHDKNKILVLGGSQGSKIINQTIHKILPEITKITEVNHIVGALDYNEFIKLSLKNYKCYKYYEKLGSLMQESKIVVSRSGASTLAEISASGKPSIIIPLKTAKNDHQLINAKIYSETDSAVMISEEELLSENLLDVILKLIDNEALRKKISDNVRQFYVSDSANKIANIIYESNK